MLQGFYKLYKHTQLYTLIVTNIPETYMCDLQENHFSNFTRGILWADCHINCYTDAYVSNTNTQKYAANGHFADPHRLTFPFHTKSLDIHIHEDMNPFQKLIDPLGSTECLDISSK